MIEKKEHPMNVIALSIILIVRVLIPLTILLTLGEWAQRREKNYWLRM
jgi:FtsZ-interacting cell division protein ZipA